MEFCFFIQTSSYYKQVIGGKLENKEPFKCEGWEWIDANNLPSNVFGALEEVFSCPNIYKGLQEYIKRNK